MPARPQDYSSHRRWYPLYHFVVLPILIVNFSVEAGRAFGDPSLRTVWAAVVALALGLLAVAARTMALTVQDRVIRLEMRQRLQSVLPPALAARAGELRRRQLVALRFAGDAELPSLVERCLAGELRGGNAIKREIRVWQADWWRA